MASLKIQIIHVNQIKVPKEKKNKLDGTSTVDINVKRQMANFQNSRPNVSRGMAFEIQTKITSHKSKM